MKIYGVIGWKNSGKTTLLEGLAREITARGFSVSTVKHAHHGFDLDQPGKDSHRHRAAGARQVLVASGARWALMTEALDAPLAELLARLDPVDLVLIEGYKRDAHPKIEVRRGGAGVPIAPGDPTVEAIACDCAVQGEGLPVFGLDDVAEIADFILARTGLVSRRVFETIVVVDWSSRGSPSPARPSADALWVGVARGGEVEELRYFRTRGALMEWLAGMLAAEVVAGRRVLAGFDFPFGYPAGFSSAVTGRAEALGLWAHLAGVIEDGPDNANNRFEVAAAINERLPGTGPFWGRPAGRVLAALPERAGARVHGFAERRLVEERVPGAQTVWKLYTTGSVGGQALTGLPALERLRADPRLTGAIAVWPFEGGLTLPEVPIVLAEVYPSLLGPLRRPGIKDAVQVTELARAFAALDRAGQLGPLFAPGLSPEAGMVAGGEGWILGVGFEASLRGGHGADELALPDPATGGR